MEYKAKETLIKNAIEKLLGEKVSFLIIKDLEKLVNDCIDVEVNKGKLIKSIKYFQ